MVVEALAFISLGWLALVMRVRIERHHVPSMSVYPYKNSLATTRDLLKTWLGIIFELNEYNSDCYEPV